MSVLLCARSADMLALLGRTRKRKKEVTCMKTLSFSGFNGSSVSMPSISGILSRSPHMASRLNKMTGRRIPMLKAASRRSKMNLGLPWLIGAGAVALLGAGLGFAAKKFGRHSMMHRQPGGESSSASHNYSINEKYPAGFASAGSIPTPSRTTSDM
jgi:hypothetical protein